MRLAELIATGGHHIPTRERGNEEECLLPRGNEDMTFMVVLLRVAVSEALDVLIDVARGL